MNLASAKKILEFVHVIETVDGKPVKVYAPAHEARYSLVTFKRGQGIVTVDCMKYQVFSDADEGERCLGCQRGKICYHVLAALLHCSGEKLRFFDSEKEARRKKGIVITIKALVGDGTVYGVYPREEARVEVSKGNPTDRQQPQELPSKRGTSPRTGSP